LGGLGIKNLALFNLSLLCKWKWRCLNDDEATWHVLLKFRYGSFAENFLCGEGKERLKKSSIWWRDLWSLGGEVDGGSVLILVAFLEMVERLDFGKKNGLV
jgi:hypothetical protein